MKPTAIILILVGIFTTIFLKNRPANRQLQGAAMGTTWQLQWRGKSPPPASILLQVSTTLEKWEQILSHWRPDSDLSRHNQGAPPSPELAHVISLADSFKSKTHGAFSHHLLASSHHEGFGPPGHGIDLSAIGKGFTVDRVGETLRQIGLTDFIFELGGEILVGDGEWEIHLEAPDPATRTPIHPVKLNRQAIATSGNYRQFHPTENRQLPSHILDPRTAKPVIRPPTSVSVIAADCATADAWATALFVLGPDHPTPPDITVIWLNQPTPLPPPN